MFLGEQGACMVVSLGSLCPRTDTLPARDVNELGRTFPGGLSFPAAEPNLPPSPRRFARAGHRSSSPAIHL
jgi:hypothetical protein